MSRKLTEKDINVVPFKLENISIDKINASKMDIKEEDYKEKVPVKLNIDTDSEIREEEFYSIINIKVKCDMFSIELQVRGYFIKLDETSDKNIKNFIDTKSIIIMWPYIRKYVSNTIQDFGYEPFYLPIINNINDISNDSKEE